MEFPEATLLSFLLILLIGLFIPELFKKLRLPFVSSLIIIGSVVGPHGLEYLQSNEIIQFFGFLGFTFLMFIAGLETKLKHIRKYFKRILILAVSNSLVPFLLGVLIAKLFNFDWLQAIILGTVFTSSSVAIIIPSLKSAKLLRKKDGQLMLSAVILQDITSLILLAIIFQSVNPISDLPLHLYFIILIVSIVALFLILPKVSNYIFKKHLFFNEPKHEEQLRFIILILIAVIFYFSLLGIHPILASFIVGMLLSETITSKKIRTKIHTLGYGLFVPIFFVIVGMEMDLSVFKKFELQNLIIPTIIISLILAKFTSGYLAGRYVKMSANNSKIFGIVSTTQLTTTLAATYAAATTGLLDSTIVTAILILSIVTTIFAPILLRFYPQRIDPEILKKQETPEEEDLKLDVS